MEGFFDADTTTSKATTYLLPQCGACGLFKGCKSPKMKLDGEGRKGILVVGEGPGFNEDREGKPFVGVSGILMNEEFRRLGANFRRDCWIYNSVICRPTTKSGKNRTPTDKEVDYCRPNVTSILKRLQPKVILLLGKSAIKSLVGMVWRDNLGSLSSWVGAQIPERSLNAWLCPTWHPAYIVRERQGRDGDLYNMFFRNHLKNALRLEERPWMYGTPGSLESKIDVILDVERASNLIRKMIERGGPISFDYETTTLKPGGLYSEIYTCSVCWRGKKTIAYPWHGEAIKATKELLQSDLPKVGWNMPFEENWSMTELGTRVRNWVWDGMQASHVIDNRSGITSLKFQAFTKLGIGPYDEVVGPYLKPKRAGGYSPNTIKEAPLKKVLTYCGIDSLLEYEIGMSQRSEMGFGEL